MTDQSQTGPTEVEGPLTHVEALGRRVDGFRAPEAVEPDPGAGEAPGTLKPRRTPATGDGGD